MGLSHWLRWLEDPLDAVEEGPMAEETMAGSIVSFYQTLVAGGLPLELAAKMASDFCDASLELVQFEKEHQICASHAHEPPDDGPRTNLPDAYYRP